MRKIHLTDEFFSFVQKKSKLKLLIHSKIKFVLNYSILGLLIQYLEWCRLSKKE